MFLNDLPPEPLTTKPYHRISYLSAAVYKVSVRAENSAGHNTEPVPSVLYTIQELTPPTDVQVMNRVVNGSLLAELSWNNSFNFDLIGTCTASHLSTFCSHVGTEGVIG